MKNDLFENEKENIPETKVGEMSDEILQGSKHNDITSEQVAYLRKLGYTKPSEVVYKMERAGAEHPKWKMQSSLHQGQIITLLLHLIGAKRTLDLGTFLGFSALYAALAIPKD